MGKERGIHAGNGSLGSARRWRAVFGGSPKTSFHKPFPGEEQAKWVTKVWAGRPNRHAGLVRSPSDSKVGFMPLRGGALWARTNVLRRPNAEAA